MSRLFQKHYTRDEAEALLPSIVRWFQDLDELRHRLHSLTRELEPSLDQGTDIGGESVNSAIRIESRIQEILQEFGLREIQIKDPDRWLIDFPAIIGDREVFLCWQKGETCVEFWHDLQTGFTGRRPL